MKLNERSREAVKGLACEYACEYAKYVPVTMAVWEKYDGLLCHESVKEACRNCEQALGLVTCVQMEDVQFVWMCIGSALMEVV